MRPAIEVRDVFRVYSTPEGDAAALQGLSLAVAEREVVTILGPSGSGKTTLLRLLAGFERPSAGSVRVFGEDVGRAAGRRLGDFRAATLGYVDQRYSRALAAELPARELVALHLGLSGDARRTRLARADELLERVGLGEKREARPGELSGGEQQRVAVCAAVAHRPRLLLADEPTGELDASSADAVYEVVGELAREHGCTMVLVSHDPESVSVADRIVRIRDGRVSEEAGRREGGDEALVVGRGGWLRLPEELLLRAGIRARATAWLEDRRIVVTAAEREEAPPAPVTRRTRGRSTHERSGIVAEVRSLTKTYGSAPRATTVLAHLSASFEAGKLTVVTGPSGSGKTTLLHVVAGLDTPTAGEAVVLGTRLSRLARAERAAFRRATIALVAQDPMLVPFLGARENVELTLALRGVPREEVRDLALSTLAAVGLAERSEQRLARLSAGERQRVAIARAVAARPALLLADEPTGRLDQANALAVAGLLRELAAESGAAVVCATHDPLVVEQADEEVALAGSPLASRHASRSTPASSPR